MKLTRTKVQQKTQNNKKPEKVVLFSFGIK
jgi:hypothetical protein